ncbi:hypothetical protein Mal52_44890 [Symmachiella dynata]|uniref:Uncharacterized protein n=1 Tax=Symmachiella dynata TaxID=2527995 RepID=A0A517ZU50_9PLAN|nr:hypothetical protein [Symmachiella dynata]QDU45992.1 hypothetical protein Mal52_44890 [Symmachiella dynata]
MNNATNRRSTIPACIAIVVCVAVVVSILTVRRAAEREYASYETLCSLGAEGDDWVSFLEIITGRPPIVQLEIPAEVPKETTFALLPDLRNLEALTLAYDSLTDRQLDTISELGLNSLNFEGDFPTDSDISRLSRFRGVQFIYVPPGNLSSEAQNKVRALLSSSIIDFD